MCCWVDTSIAADGYKTCVSGVTDPLGRATTVDALLNHPRTKVFRKPTDRFGVGTLFRGPDGRGLFFDEDGIFRYFPEP